MTGCRLRATGCHKLQDDARTSVAEVRETYRQRKDCLLERRAQPKEAAVSETFSLGAVNALRSIHMNRGHRVVEFESSARADGLVRRDEQARSITLISYTTHALCMGIMCGSAGVAPHVQGPCCMEEHYADRVDMLHSRAVVLGRPTTSGSDESRSAQHMV